MRIYVNHLGYKPGDTNKKALVKGDQVYDEFLVIDLNAMGYNEIGPNTAVNQVAYKGKLSSVNTDMGTYSIADFSDFNKPGIYLISLNNEYNSVPFQIRADVYSRTLRKAFDYIHIQRCGTDVAGYHDACHLDDAIRRDNGEYVDTTGGWHDAGDLRKWMAHTMLLAVAISQLKRNVNPEWKTFDSKEGDLLNELRWGNAFFLKMMDKNGLVWNDVAAGLEGDNSDNHWTDNLKGTTDDRHINTAFNPEIQWEFIYLQAFQASLFEEIDKPYSKVCLNAAVKALDYIKDYKNSDVKFMAWRILAMKELYLKTGENSYLSMLKAQLGELLKLQESAYIFGQETVTGYFYRDAGKKDFFRDLRDSSIILIALCEVVKIIESDEILKSNCIRAIDLYSNGYIVPMQKTNPFGITPFSLYSREETVEKYRLLGGELKYRFFSPIKGDARDGVSYLGLTSHLLSHAVGLQMAGNILKDNQLKDIARSHMEWVMGRNPFNSCLMTAEGINNPYPHSRFLGLIPGGIMNGIVGLEDDEPFLDMNYGMDWRTTEYWSPHVCFYIWYISLIC